MNKRRKRPSGVATLKSGPTSAEVISALHRDFSGNYAAAARYAEQVASQGGRDADVYRRAADWFKRAAKNPRKRKTRRRGGNFAQRMAAARAAKRARRPKRRNPSRYKGRGEYIVVAQKKGGRVLRLVEGNKFAQSGRPVVFPTERAAAATARWLRRLFPVLKGYNPHAAPR